MVLFPLSSTYTILNPYATIKDLSDVTSSNLSKRENIIHNFLSFVTSVACWYMTAFGWLSRTAKVVAN